MLQEQLATAVAGRVRRRRLLGSRSGGDNEFGGLDLPGAAGLDEDGAADQYPGLQIGEDDAGDEAEGLSGSGRSAAGGGAGSRQEDPGGQDPVESQLWRIDSGCGLDLNAAGDSSFQSIER